MDELLAKRHGETVKRPRSREKIVWMHGSFSGFPDFPTEKVHAELGSPEKDRLLRGVDDRKTPAVSAESSMLGSLDLRFTRYDNPGPLQQVMLL